MGFRRCCRGACPPVLCPRRRAAVREILVKVKEKEPKHHHHHHDDDHKHERPDLRAEAALAAAMQLR